MTTAHHTIPTLEDYAFDLRKGLRAAAKASLSSLEDLINEVGYGWLDGYMDGVMDTASRAPFAELIKTPSRTQTSKKTRATTQAVKDRSQKIKGVNAKLGLSPVTVTTSKTSLSSRPDHSPLQPKALNALQSPASRTIHTSPSKSNSKTDKPVPLIAVKSSNVERAPVPTKSKAKGKKTKKMIEKENMNVDEVEDSSASSSSRVDIVGNVPKHTQYLSPPKALSPIKRQNNSTPARVTRSISRSPTKNAQGAPSASMGAVAERILADEPVNKKFETLDGPNKAKSPSSKSKVVDLSLITEGNEDRSSSSIGSKRPRQNGDEDVTAVGEKDNFSAAQRKPASSPASKRRSSPVLSRSSPAKADTISATTAETAHVDMEPIPIPSVVAAPPVPVRQVRSSWLRQALGTGTVPITGGLPLSSTGSDNASGAALRKSFADQSAMRKSYAASANLNNNGNPTGPPRAPGAEYAGLRKSLVPFGGLSGPGSTGSSLGVGNGKRKSDEGLDDDQLRPAKVVKIDPRTELLTGSIPREAPSTIPSATGISTTLVAPRQTAFPQLPPLPTLPSLDMNQTDDIPNHSSSNGVHDKNRSDIHKVTKALDEMRERNLAKQKAAALAASTAASRSGSASTSTPGPVTSASASASAAASVAASASGFLRGLGSLGRSLVGSNGDARNAEDEAMRLAKELEDDRRAEREAEEELKRLMEGMEGDDDDHRSVVHSVSGSGSALVVKPRDVPDHGQKEGVDELEEDEVLGVLDERPQPQPLNLKSKVEPSSPRWNYAERSIPGTTTPNITPPRNLVIPPPVLTGQSQNGAPHHHSKQENTLVPPSRSVQTSRDVMIEAPKATSHVAQVVAGTKLVMRTEQNQTRERAPATNRDDQYDDDGDVEVDELEEEVERIPEIPRKTFVTVQKHSHQQQQQQPQPSNRSSVVSVATSQLLGISTSSTSVTGGVSLSQASLIAQKSLGMKPVPGHVKALAAAAAARDKEQSNAERKQYLKDQAEQRKVLAARKKVEEERLKAEKEKEAKAAADEERRRIRLDLEKRRKEREEKAIIAARDKAAREERENAAAAKLKADEEANRKRKMAPMLNKSSTLNPSKKVVPTSGLNSSVKGKESIRPAGNLNSSLTASKMGPTSFRTGPNPLTASMNPEHQHQSTITHTQSHTHTSTVTLVGSSTAMTPNNVGFSQIQTQNQERRALGPPSRPSAMAASGLGVGAGAGTGAGASSVLQQSRVTLQSQLEQKAVDMQSEEIVLPDIASEYSDSDDEDKPSNFNRPQWADSPELRRALEQQSTFNPDELFGPIKPLSMEELFKVRTGKFRNRTSSANWGGGDRLTAQEEVEYAKKMGFRSK